MRLGQLRAQLQMATDTFVNQRYLFTPTTLQNLTCCNCREVDQKKKQVFGNAVESAGFGTMNNKRAEEILEGHPEGTWLLRYNQRGGVRISIKKITRVSHLKIYTSTEGYTINPRDDPYPLSDLLNYLRDELKLKTQITPHHHHISNNF